MMTLLVLAVFSLSNQSKEQETHTYSGQNLRANTDDSLAVMIP